MEKMLNQIIFVWLEHKEAKSHSCIELVWQPWKLKLPIHHQWHISLRVRLISSSAWFVLSLIPIVSLMIVSIVVLWKQEFMENSYVLHAKCANWKAFWKRTRWMMKRRKRGRLNQNRSSPGSTTGAPLNTSPLSWILSPIFVIICSLAPTSKIAINGMNGSQ